MLLLGVNSNARCGPTSTASSLVVMGETTKRKPPEKWQIEDAARLKKLFEQHATESQEKFGQRHGIGNQSAVYQYLSGRIPLNLRVALKFAGGLKVQLEEISPTLASEVGGNSTRQITAQYTLQAAAMMEDFNALPVWLQEHITRKTAELRKYADSLPAFVREGMKAPPKDQAGYQNWEREIEADMAKRKLTATDSQINRGIIPGGEPKFRSGEAPLSRERKAKK
jgi:hypothetical protein